MKFVVISALFTAALSLFASPSISAPQQPASIELSSQLVGDEPAPAINECVAAGGTCRKSACRTGEVVSFRQCGHDLGCCLPQ
jgi:hypothetical protein